MIKPTITVTALQAVTILTPSKRMTRAWIQNNGAVAIRIAIDGGAPAGLTDPTTTKGARIDAYQGLWLPIIFGSNMTGLQQDIPPIRAIAESATTTVDVVTDDPTST